MFSVYIVDDDPYILDSLPTDIPWQENGFEICGKSRSPQLALEEIRKQKPHVVLCDLKMPGMDGIALMRALQKDALDCEYVMLSAYSEFSDARDFFLQGGYDYLLKPPDPINMHITLERLARKLMKKHHVEQAAHQGRGGNARIDEIMSYITRNYDKKITLDILADELGVSTVYISSLFSKHYGQPLTVFLTNFRMKEAARKMENTNKQIKEIAAECGYSDYYYFCRVFKEFYGVPPGEYMSRKR